MKRPPTIIANEFAIHNYRVNNQKTPTIIAVGERKEKFVAVWQSYNHPADGNQGGIFASVFNSSDGSRIVDEFLVNNYTQNNQETPKACSVGANNEKFVIVWQSTMHKEDPYTLGIFGQLFSSDDYSKINSEFLVNTHTTDDQSNPSIASIGAQSEKFVITWQSYDQDGDQMGIFAQIFNSSDGGKINPEFQVNTFTQNEQSNPSIASIGSQSEKFVITWQSYDQNEDQNGIFAQVFNSETGGKIESEFRVNTYTSSDQKKPSIASIGAQSEKFVITWQSYDQDGNQNGIFAQVFNSENDGGPIGAEFRVNSHTMNDQENPSIASIGTDNRHFAIIWESNQQDGNQLGIFAQIYNSEDCQIVVEEFGVNEFFESDQNNPGIFSLGENGEEFVAVWQSYNQDGDGYGVYAQVYSSQLLCLCDRGYYSQNDGTENCYECPIGTYQNERGHTQCCNCTAGQYQANTGQSRCQDCPRGTFQNLEGTSKCDPCPSGEYQMYLGQATCEACPDGKYNAHTGASECENCGAGTYADQKHSTECVPCRNGTYNDMEGSTSESSCHFCEMGTFSVNEGASECTKCATGQYNNDRGLTACFSCLSGSYSDTDGSTTCKLCTPGEFQDENGQTQCDSCPFDTYQSNIGSKECNYCPMNSETLSTQRKSVKECYCSIGFYGVNGEICHKCPDEGICIKFNQHHPFPRPGYWSSRNNRDVIFKCPIYESCPGGEEIEACNITAGYSGFKCTECTKGFYKMDSRCEACPQNATQRLSLIVLIFLFFILILLFIAKKATAYFGSFTISFSFLQILIIIYQLNIDWPPNINRTFKLFLPFNFNLDFLATECSFQFDYIEKWYLFQAFPFICLFLFLIIYLILFAHTNILYRYGNNWILRFPRLVYKPSRATDNIAAYCLHLIKYSLVSPFFQSLSKRQLKKFKDIFINVFLTLLTLIYLILSQKTLEIFNCKYDSYSEKYIFEPEPNYYCFESWWKKLLPLSIISIVLYIVGIPILIVYLLVKNSKVLTEKEFDLKFGLLCSRYSKSFFFWEIIIMIRKLLIVIIKSFVSEYTILQIILLLIILFATLILQFVYQPYIATRHNFLESILLGIPQIILFAGLIFYNNEFTRNAQNKEKLIVFIILSISIGVVFLILITIFDIYYRFQISKFEKNIKLQEKIQKRKKMRNKNDNDDLKKRIQDHTDHLTDFIIKNRLNTSFKGINIIKLIQNKKVSLLLLLNWLSTLNNQNTKKNSLFKNKILEYIDVKHNKSLIQSKKNNTTQYKHLFKNDLVYKFTKWYHLKATLFQKIKIKILLESLTSFILKNIDNNSENLN
ncbi:insulin-like growth factor binding protein [Anaeramoeba flamelloides]|uniref:Insulin-like growth factor binding protein n=1 Tax=Anaeramoeba flamelloides TaxID=1746091 RepID=A0ABQ8XN49_9EUKA|nr:insulin-like growth factor binding protein [Anaeramoeba flamelloides]